MSEIVSKTLVFGNCLELRINRESSLNALNGEVISTLLEILQSLNDEYQESKEAKKFRNDFPRVVLITGAGEKSFIAGADISQLATPAAAEFLDQGICLMEALQDLPIPTIANVNGFCLGGGLELALSCDLIVASESSKFGLPELGLGLIPGFGGTQRLVKRCGIGTARRLILTAEKISAHAAYASGIVDLIISNDNSATELEKFVSSIKKLSPLALEAAKKALILADTKTRAEGLEGERELFLKLLTSTDAKEGLSAFMEKRTPDFKGI